MSAAEYFKHARSLGAFSAADCLELARQAAALDEAAQARKSVPFVDVSCETLPDGSGLVKLSNSVRVF
jgi:hypothetical protein